MTVSEFDKFFRDESACKAYLVRRRWPEGVRCPRCGNDNLAELKARPFHWQCKTCAPNGYRFSVLVGTIFENTNVPLRAWFKVIYLMLVSEKGIGALQVRKVMGFGSYRTAHYLCHRVRAGLADPEFRKLVGIVEVDENSRKEAQLAQRQADGAPSEPASEQPADHDDEHDQPDAAAERATAVIAGAIAVASSAEREHEQQNDDERYAARDHRRARR